MRISDLFESAQNSVVIYPGRFHPFHKGHAAVYKWLSSKFNDVYIATSNKIDPPKSPFSFEEKKRMMMHAGVPASAIVQVKNPYIATEITDRYDPENTAVVFAVSEKDMAEDPRFQFKPKKDGSPSYYRPYGSNMEPLSKHGYIVTTPTFDFTVLGEPMRSATELRRNFANADTDTQAKMIKDLYGSYDPTIHKIMAAKITQ
jgi:cytidyltransferase-like protein